MMEVLEVFDDFGLQRVKKVIGIEMCPEAVEDAKVNASLNGKRPDDFMLGASELCEI